MGKDPFQTHRSIRNWICLKLDKRGICDDLVGYRMYRTLEFSTNGQNENVQQILALRIIFDVNLLENFEDFYVFCPKLVENPSIELGSNS